MNYYNGGFGSLGSGPGPNFGITFGPDAIACNGGATGSCNTDQIPGGPGAQIAFFLTGPGDVVDKASGFDTGFSFFYSAINNPGEVTVWSGLDGTGTMLADLNLPTTPGNGDGCARPFCPFFAAGVSLQRYRDVGEFYRHGESNCICGYYFRFGNPGYSPNPRLGRCSSSASRGLDTSRDVEG